MSCAVVFGGTGFIGASFANYLLESAGFSKVYLFDRENVADKASVFRQRLISADSRISVVIGDVRSPVEWVPSEPVSLIANFAAVHREPGHEDYEYYQTNLLGAENVCSWAERVGCESIVFTSSISPYGIGEEVKSELSLPVPATAYGASKLAAEKIHQIWLAKNNTKRRLVIVRPGVVFGPGEGGNVSRLIKAVLHRYFFYMGNRATRKAGVYVKELCNAIWWVLQRQRTEERNFTLFNMSMNPGPSIEDYVRAVCKVADVSRIVPGVPYTLLLTAAYAIDAIARPLGVEHPFSPVRIRKLVRSNNIHPAYLAENGYRYLYTLESAFADWKKNCLEEWQ